MRRQSGLPASRAALPAPGSLPQVTAHLVKRVSMLAQPLLPLTNDPAVVRVGQQKMQAWWEHLCPNLRTQERLHLHAFACKEHTVSPRALIDMACAVLNVLRCPPRGSLPGMATLCQK
jgi:hypothetical protein